MTESGAVQPAPGAPPPQAAGTSDLTTRHPDKGRLRVFISYSRLDHEFADQLLAALETCGFECIIDREDISGGEDWKKRLAALIVQADTVVFVLSPSSARSEVCGWEVEQSASLGKRILPVVSESLGDHLPPPRLQSLNYVLFYPEPEAPGSGFGQGLKSLVQALNTDYDWLREHTRYLQRATEWDGGGRPASRLLTGSDIAEAKAWAASRPRSAPEVTTLQLDFIHASETEEQARSNEELQRLKALQEASAEREAALRDKEIAVERAQAEQRMRAKTEIIRNALLIVSVALLVVAAATAIGAVQSAITARKERQHAEALLASAKPIVAGAQYRMDDDGRTGAFRFFQEAASFGDPNSIGYVGVSYRNGWGVPRDYGKAVHFLEEAANQGDANAMDNLGAIFDSGEAAKQGFAANPTEARKWYEKAAETNWANAMVNLARLYADQRGAAPDYGQAMNWYQKAAGMGQQEAMFALGALYEAGHGADANLAKAREWYEQAAKAGHAGAMVRLGSMDESGDPSPDLGGAIHWYQAAAQQNDPQAMVRLGALNNAGRGVSQDTAVAISWFTQAASGGSAEAMRRLGEIYDKGAVVAADPAKARSWLDAAERQSAASAGGAVPGD